MIRVRFLAVLLSVALTGPSVGALVCELACAAAHQQTPGAGGCHEQDATGSSISVAAGHVCHDVSPPGLSIVAGSAEGDSRIAADAESPSLIALPAAQTRVATPPRVASHAPPSALSIPLRI